MLSQSYFAAGLSQAVALSQSPLPQTESSLSRNPALVRDWANRLLANDPKVRATAEAALVQGAAAFAAFAETIPQP